MNGTLPELSTETVDLVIVDVDNVLYPGNVGMELAKKLASGFRALRAVARVGAAVVKYRATRGSITDVVGAACSLFEGEDAAALTIRVQDQTRAGVIPALRPELVAWLATRPADLPLVLFSASPQAAVDAVGESLGAARAFGADVEVDGRGRLTARPIEPIPHGPGKVTLAERAAAELGVSLERAIFLGDSTSDVLLLEAVGVPVCVVPSKGARDIATQKGWPIVTF